MNADLVIIVGTDRGECRKLVDDRSHYGRRWYVEPRLSRRNLISVHSASIPRYFSYHDLEPRRVWVYY